MGRRRPWLAALLALLTVGLGDVYNGKVARGVTIAVVATGISLVLLTAFVLSASVVPLAIAVVGATGLYGFSAVRAFRDARALGESPESHRSWWYVVAYCVVAMIVGTVLPDAIREHVIRAYRVPSRNMFPTLEIGDHVLAEAWAFGRLAPWIGGPSEPAVGDVIVFIHPKERSLRFLKRVVARSGQTVEMRGSTLLVDGTPREEAYARYLGRSDDFGPSKVPPGHLFVLGDNRDESYDSRFWGPVPVADVRGRVASIYWSWDDDWRVRWDRLGRRVE